MKKIFFLFIAVAGVAFVSAQNVGINTPTPQAMLHVKDSNVLFSGPNNVLANTPYSPPIEGPGARLMWYPQKAAFRAGLAFGNQWNKDSIGILSIALGNSTKAKGESSFASGAGTNASGNRSTATGDFTTASGNASFATGLQTVASADYSFAAGTGSNATGFAAFSFGQVSAATSNTAIAMGINAQASSFSSLAIGQDVRAASQNSIALGRSTYTVGNISMAAGYMTKATADYSTVLGSFNDTTETANYFNPQPSDRIFQIGNGLNDNNRKNAITILRNAHTGIGTPNPVARLHVADSSVVFTAASTLPVTANNPPVSGGGTRMMWYSDKAAFRSGNVLNTEWNNENVGRYSFAIGQGTIASGSAANALGVGNISSGDFSFTSGNGNSASGLASAAIGSNNIASAPSSTAMGSDNNVSGFFSTVMGRFNKAKSDFSLVLGLYNDTTANNRLFEIGNGTANNARNNAMTVLRNGNIGIGTTSPIKPLSFPATLGEKILLYPGAVGEVGIGVYGNELRLHSDNAGASVSFGTQTNAGVFTQAGRFQISGAYGLFVNGSIWANGTTYASDERFKQNISSINSPLQKLLQLNGVEYEMKTSVFHKNNFQLGRQMGLLAQNVEKVVPEAVNEMDGYKGVDYARLVPLLIESIKELKLENDLQKKRIEALEQNFLKQ